MNLGSALIKMFQIIEILGKLLYLPIYFQGFLLNVLYSVEQLGSLVSLPSDLIFSTDGAQKNRYWMKFSIYENEENIFQSEVISAIALSVSPTNLVIVTPIGFSDRIYCSEGAEPHAQGISDSEKSV